MVRQRQINTGKRESKKNVSFDYLEKYFNMLLTVVYYLFPFFIYYIFS
jgi:hypothetical protein